MFVNKISLNDVIPNSVPEPIALYKMSDITHRDIAKKLAKHSIGRF